jgi:hypothetical protein
MTKAQHIRKQLQVARKVWALRSKPASLRASLKREYGLNSVDASLVASDIIIKSGVAAQQARQQLKALKAA